MLPRREASSHKTICRRKSKYCSPLHFTIKTDFNASATGAITCIEILRICQANRGFFRLTGSSSEVQQKTQGSSCEQCKQIGSSKLRSLLRFKDTNTKKQRWNQFVLTCWISHWSLDDNGTKKNSRRVKINGFFSLHSTHQFDYFVIFRWLSNSHIYKSTWLNQRLRRELTFTAHFTLYLPWLEC